MNERIDKLRIEAAEWMKTQGHPFEYRSNWEKQCDEKFAELIVQKCADVCLGRHDTWRWDDEPDSDSGPRDCAQSIKKHFGIE
jgi:hypothetical protein